MKQARRTTVAGVHLGLVVSLLTCIVLYVFRYDISYIFSDDPVVSTFVVMLLPILMLYQFVDGAQIVLSNALRGLADVKSIMWITFLTNFLIAIPAGYLLGFPLGMGIQGIMARISDRFCLLGSPPGHQSKETDEQIVSVY